MDAGRRLLVEQAFERIKAGRKDLLELLDDKRVVDDYFLALVSQGRLGARLFEEEVLKDG